MRTSHPQKGIKHATGVLFAVAVMALGAAACARVHDPWDNTDHFKQDRGRSAELEKLLRERALHGETDRNPGIQQVNRTS